MQPMSIAAGLVATNYRGVGRQVELGLGRSNLVTQRRKVAILDGANAGIVGRLGGEGQFPVLPAEFEGEVENPGPCCRLSVSRCHGESPLFGDN